MLQRERECVCKRRVPTERECVCVCVREGVPTVYVCEREKKRREREKGRA